ncbi:prolyl oligopeptidase family serine peptidase [Phaeobacter sp.]|uniref:alpha/beta hydrolase family esterase n=1 Tax=Phaeobacter sp. TaxID=1902409 RepID=UPI0025E329D0|nr:prolyl oligopeptidase family serine peptidase [Phaeobacter sp.]
MKRFAQAAVAALAALCATPSYAEPTCGTRAGVCELPGGTYHIALPTDAPDGGAETAWPTVMFLHGYGGSAAAAMRNSAMVDGLTSRGYAVIAPNALPREPGGPRSWAFLSSFGRRDESKFFDDVLQDAATKFDIDPQRAVLSGFSAGGFMTVYLACANPDQFVAYAPVSGGFWRPQPDKCAGPVRMFHTHGWTDPVVPLEGRFIGGGRFQQGDIFAGLELWRDTNGCETHAPDRRWQQESTLRRAWDCGIGRDIEFVLFPGGHQVPKDWPNWMLDWLEKPDLID